MRLKAGSQAARFCGFSPLLNGALDATVTVGSGGAATFGFSPLLNGALDATRLDEIQRLRDVSVSVPS